MLDGLITDSLFFELILGRLWNEGLTARAFESSALRSRVGLVLFF